MLFWPSEEGFWPLINSIDSEVKKKLCPCYNGRNFEQNQSNISFCRMYGTAVMQTISNSTIIKNIDKMKLIIHSALHCALNTYNFSHKGTFCKIRIT